MDSSENGNVVGDRGNIVDVTLLENQFKKDKCRAKSNFTRLRNTLLQLVDEEDMPSRRVVKEACRKMDTYLEIVMGVLSKLLDFYIKNGEIQKDKKLIKEMENIEEDYYTAYGTTQEYLNSRKDDSSSVTSDILTIDMLQGLNISDEPETSRKDNKMSLQRETFNEERILDQQSKTLDCSPTTVSQGTCTNYQLSNHTEPSSNKMIHGLTERWDTIVTTSLEPHMQAQNHRYGQSGASTTDTAYPVEDQTRLKTFSQFSRCSHLTNRKQCWQSIGQDLWRQLKRVEIPVFSGDKRSYPNWRAAFTACIDSVPATVEYKLLQLRQYLTGEGLKPS